MATNQPNNEIPNWGLYLMLIASAVGTFLLFRQLLGMGFPGPFKRGN